MFELLSVLVFIWLMGKAVGLAFKLTWGLAKITASILMGLAVPVLIFCFVFAGGILMMVPLVMIAIAAGILKACE